MNLFRYLTLVLEKLMSEYIHTQPQKFPKYIEEWKVVILA